MPKNQKMTNSFLSAINSNLIAIYTLAVIFLSFFTYFYNYQNPPAPFWDENYHIVASEKYIQNSYFMEPHPPLGKLFIALGEVIINPNKGLDKSEFLNTDYIEGDKIPNGYSFAGVRFFPALFGWLAAPLFFLALFQILKNPHLALIFSSFYVFDNAMIVHFRGAMLDSFLIFFALATINYFLYAWQKIEDQKQLKWFDYLALGTLVGLTVAVKLNGLIVILFPLLLLFKQFIKGFLQILPDLSKYANQFLQDPTKTSETKNTADILKPRNQSSEISQTAFKTIQSTVINSIVGGVIVLASFIFVFNGVFYIHFALANQNRNDSRTQTYLEGIYSLDDRAVMRQILDTPNLSQKLLTTLPFQSLFITYQNLGYTDNYNKGVPKLDITKSDENGSSPFTWPFGNRAISYRWASDNGFVSYLYILPNPASWFLAFLGLVLLSVWIIAALLFGAKIRDNNTFQLGICLAFVYWAYMISVIQIQRVMYLYHYLIPLVISMLAFAVIFKEITFNLKENSKILIASTIALFIFLSFAFYSPFTYYFPIDTAGFELRNLFEFWQLRKGG